MSEAANPMRYEVRVGGVLGEALLRAFSCLEASIERGDTVLRGPLRDQAQLFGLLSRIEALGLELLEVRRTDA